MIFLIKCVEVYFMHKIPLVRFFKFISVANNYMIELKYTKTDYFGIGNVSNKNTFIKFRVEKFYSQRRSGYFIKKNY